MDESPSDDNQSSRSEDKSAKPKEEVPVQSETLQASQTFTMIDESPSDKNNQSSTFDDISVQRETLQAPQTIIVMDEPPSDNNIQSSIPDDISVQPEKKKSVRTSKRLKVHRNPFMNYLREFRKENKGTSNIEIYKQGGINWKELNQNEKLKFNFKFIQRTINVPTIVPRKAKTICLPKSKKQKKR